MDSVLTICQYLHEEEKSASESFDDEFEAAGIDADNIENVSLSELCVAAPKFKDHIYYHIRVAQEHFEKPATEPPTDPAAAAAAAAKTAAEAGAYVHQIFYL